MKSTNEIIQFLKQILDERTSEKEKAELIKDFQNEVWYDESPDESTLNEILSELAYDLDFYEPNEEERNEDFCLYGNDRLYENVKIGIERLKEYEKASH